MKKKSVAWNWLLWPALVLTLTSNLALGADCPSDIKAVTNTDVAVPVDVLSHRVKPLTKCELEV